MEQARKLVNHSPTPGASRAASPIPLPETTAASIMELLKDITEHSEDCKEGTSKKPLKEGKAAAKWSIQNTQVHHNGYRKYKTWTMIPVHQHLCRMNITAIRSVNLGKGKVSFIIYHSRFPS
jgi:hypothetical protein